MAEGTETGPDFELSTIGQIALTAHDLDRATAFTRDTLGIPFLFRVPNLAFFDRGGVRLMLGLPVPAASDRPPPSASTTSTRPTPPSPIAG